MNSINQYYAEQAAGMPYFAGPTVQHGHGLGGIFRSIFRAVAPVFRKAAPVVKQFAKTAGTEAAKTGAAVLSDYVQGMKVSDSLAIRSKQAADRLIERGVDELTSLTKSRPKTRKSIKRKRRNQKKDIFSK